jgi:hypothetical protein
MKTDRHRRECDAVNSTMRSFYCKSPKLCYACQSSDREFGLGL